MKTMWPFSDKEKTLTQEEVAIATMEEEYKEEVKKLKDRIREKKLELKAKRMLIETAKDAQSVPFVETKPVKACLKATAVAMKPFATLHSKSSAWLKAPKEQRRKNLREKAEETLANCLACKDNEDQKAKKWCKAAANLVMIIETEIETRGTWKKGHELARHLREEVSRLRPPLTKEEVEARKAIQEQLATS